MTIVSGVLVRFELKFVTDLIVLPTIIEKEKNVASVLYKYLFGMFISI